MYRHLLVTVDGVPGGIDAIGHALELARAVGARVTFVLSGAAPQSPGSDSRLSGARMPEHGAKVEAAARAQGLSHAIAGAGDPGAGGTSPATLAGELGCDLIGVAALPHDADAGAAAQRRLLLATSGVPVLVCPARRAPAEARVMARCLAAHRALGAQLQALTQLQAPTLASEAPDSATRPAADADRALAVHAALASLAALQDARSGPSAEARLCAALRRRAESTAAELDELDRQRRRDAHALDALARLAADGLPSAAFDAALAVYARGAFEQMGRMEGVIFPAARRYLSDADWTELDAPPASGSAATTPDADEPDDA
ncbi:universal stress protein [Burkholderia sp. Bp8994]|uniref:universal stress protein n=1 Tax=unclassified Burkholderia TaxID=2613784 RepID=UPI000F56FC94|nr:MULTISPECIES: universal stress protein [unclassified Burkholderia]RQR40992.1 universal stress protein [Burkholderia sp. Bp9131]RQR73828.1 universal stress protein [Burkholderia sp. Bp9015]RQR95767.1 universal stress protein [Burkholderia sp. Bp8994]RQS41242.1 universal stress protein [Burkholderia sp. Bp8990]RQZ51039.1 universal stress protein [Burkholderia sp. Bp9099]